MKDSIQWTLDIRLDKNTLGKEEGELLSIERNGRKEVRLMWKEGILSLEFMTDEMETPMVLDTGNAGLVENLTAFFMGSRVELWSDGRLLDEDWPVGKCLPDDSISIVRGSGVLQAVRSAGVKRPDTIYAQIENAQYWAPELGRHNVGDCMPFADGDVYHLFYLKDRRQHKSKWGKGAHQFAHISTRDMVHWEEHPVAVEITHQWEGSICTGSIFKKDGCYYAFYAVRMTDGSSARISWARSTDCIHFEKSEKYFTLTEPYETTSVRDPEVFAGADGRYHMLVTTTWQDVKERGGCLAHLVSDDLENWEQKEPFVIPGFTDQPECTDYFEWNGWYYLIFSNYGTARYQYSRQPFGPWIYPENEIIDGLLYRVPKTADFHGRRIAAGFLCINTAGESYAGNLVLRELCQNADGTLGTCQVKEVLPAMGKAYEKLLVDACKGGYQRAVFSEKGKHIKVRIRREGTAGNYGLVLRTGEKTAYEIRFDPVYRRMGIYPEHSCLYYYPTKRMLAGLSGLEDGVSLELVIHEDIWDVCINGCRTLVCRMEENWEEPGQIDCFAKDCRAVFEMES